MSEARSILRLAGITAIAFIVLLVGLILLASGFNAGLVEVPFHLIGGFILFLLGNIPLISTDAGTWTPGVAAFALAILITHRMLRAWATKRSRPWSFTTSCCIALVAPVLFSMSFIVPGALLQLESLRDVRWFRKSSRPEAYMKLVLRNHAQACAYLASSHPQERFPDSLEEISVQNIMRRELIPLVGEKELPSEPPIYLGSGHTIESISTLPLLISPPYQKNSRTIRTAITITGEYLDLTEAETEEWIDRAIRHRNSVRNDS